MHPPHFSKLSGAVVSDDVSNYPLSYATTLVFSVGMKSYGLYHNTALHRPMVPISFQKFSSLSYYPLLQRCAISPLLDMPQIGRVGWCWNLVTISQSHGL